MSFDQSVLKVLVPGLIGVLLAAWGSVALAGTPEEDCSPLPPVRAQVVADWARPAQQITPLSRPEGDAPVSVGIKFKLKLLPAAEVALVMPEKPVHLNKFAGLLSFTVGKAGSYRFLSNPNMWLELVPVDGSGKEPDVMGSDPQLDCGGIAKNVVFKLNVGRYWLQMSGSLEADVQLMISAPE